MSKTDFSQQLLSSSGKPRRASDRIPSLAAVNVSARAKETLDLVEGFVEKECIPADTVYHAQLGEGEQRWKTYPPIIDELKIKAKNLGLWNLFLPKNHFKEGASFTNLEYGLMAEYMGRSRTASEACNCAAPDTGNMEVLAKYGSESQKKEWLRPLLDGDIRSAFLMTEPEVASSDATNITLTMRREGNEYILNGSVRYFFILSRPSEPNMCRNGGQVAPATLAVKSTSSWASPIPVTRMCIDSSPSCLSQLVRQG